jgi:hypothetical protein
MAKANVRRVPHAQAGADKREGTAEPSRWFDELSTDVESKRIRRHLDRLIESMIETAARRHGKDDVLRVIGTAHDPEHPDEPVDSL